MRIPYVFYEKKDRHIKQSHMCFMKKKDQQHEDPWWSENKGTLSTPVSEWEAYDTFDKAGFPKRLTKYIKSKFLRYKCPDPKAYM